MDRKVQYSKFGLNTIRGRRGGSQPPPVGTKKDKPFLRLASEMLDAVQGDEHDHGVRPSGRPQTSKWRRQAK